MALLLSLMVAPKAGADLAPGGTFVDDDGNTHEPYIEAIFARGITVGCDDAGRRFCPNGRLTRGQAATLIMRALRLPKSSADWFSDDNATTHEAGINAIRQAGITLGCDRTGRRFCPEATLTRAQMASLLSRALKLRPASTDFFRDDEGSSHEDAINRLRGARITRGCTDGASFCPAKPLTRAEMATFLARALHLAPAPPPSRLPCF